MSFTLNPILLSMPMDQDKVFKEVYEEYSKMVYSVAFRMIGPEYSNDLVHDVFLKVWKNLKTFKNMSSHKTWIYKITINTCYDFLKKNKIKFTTGLNIETEAGTRSPEIAEIINQGLLHLSKKHRSAIILVIYEGLSLEEAAKIENTNNGTMKSRVHTAKAQLITFFKENGVEGLSSNKGDGASHEKR